MADYQDIRGLRVKYLSADPSTSTLGEVWYNSVSGTLKSTVMSSATWASGGSLSESRTDAGVFGTQTAGAIASGLIMPVTGSYRSATEEYNGASWGSGGGLPTPRAYMVAGGTQTTGIVIGGDSASGAGIASTELYNGASYSAGGGLNAMPPGYSYNMLGGGPQTSAIIAGGEGHPTAGPGRQVQEYNGSTWTMSPVAYPQTISRGGFAGTNTAGLFFGGATSPSPTNLTTEWNGGSFAVGGSLGTPRHNIGSCGIQTQALCIGLDGPTGAGTICELYDGTSWAATAALGSGDYGCDSCGTTSAALNAASRVAPGTQTEEYNGAVAEIQTLTTS